MQIFADTALDYMVYFSDLKKVTKSYSSMSKEHVREKIAKLLLIKKEMGQLPVK